MSATQGDGQLVTSGQGEEASQLRDTSTLSEEEEPGIEPATSRLPDD